MIIHNIYDTVNFGKYKGDTFLDVFQFDPSYIQNFMETHNDRFIDIMQFHKNTTPFMYTVFTEANENCEVDSQMLTL
jgi:hypothetical protein